MTKVSYVITLFNKQEYIRPVLDAVLAQTGDFDREIILVNDGSTDDTLPRIEAYASKHRNIRIISIENSGPSVAFNTGINATTGDFIKFVDGDDVLCPNSTELLLRAITDTCAGLAHSGIEEVEVSSDTYQNPTANLGSPKPIPNKTAIATMIEKAHFNPSCVLVRTELAKKVGGSDDRVFIQDYSLCLRVSRIADFVQVPLVLAFAPKEAGSRLSGYGAGAQVLHDLNLALAYLLEDHSDLSSEMRSRIVKRATSRSWRWAKRLENKSVFSREFRNYMLAKIGLTGPQPEKLVFESCETFRRTSTIRFPKHLTGQS
ncbi:glycosyltransferase [Thalassospira sp. HF15]|uniref:glycosyltransferase family 2 protein n=1 Tax=Thalassospira sp. HF15 TaxID=2722755 RepID=UPI0014314762|nr:glycosyltransferase family 2 protein [Thalassospira sp. HF15]NIY75162.1 glycosyltransferase [Thalassospira sp. HF15]